MLGATVFRTGEVDPAGRFDCWRDLMSKTLCPLDMNSEHAAQFQAEARLLELGPVSVYPTIVEPMSWRRTPRLIQQSDPECYYLTFPITGSLGITQAGREAVHGPREMYVVDTSQPFQCVTSVALHAVGLEVPRKLVSLRKERADVLLTRRLPGDDGYGILLAQLLEQLANDTGLYGPADGPRLGSIIVDLLSSLLAHTLDRETSLPMETRQRTLVLRIRAFIEDNLDDPELTPRCVADAHHISLSYLHRLFQREEETLAAWIRRRRLERVRCDLTDPALSGIPIYSLATRWGFPGGADFSRIFRRTYGVTPREFRQRY
ncbi:helix-turn-helix domain-containing protein [Streptomyces coffeae]|uniref:Helix-turn-helix domain-containing protein n=1 Tax=Streptomyces coffeae TaxID=621382 RepID=A0ABS1NPY2_9ACTN|nr:helix-turn-helix domain-containing protein [Streptomyces coffeae]MBL1102014.1 helix-turn-helix domain-containing protein [Streptomyces coffeae]